MTLGETVNRLLDALADERTALSIIRNHNTLHSDFGSIWNERHALDDEKLERWLRARMEVRYYEQTLSNMLQGVERVDEAKYEPPERTVGHA